ncbi:tetratricopeptide repeat protein, partial [Micromonospora rubida]|uniref:tetratricopeptide repeat protein n=1 Tax=Micromonospora rubida TaxID=2697657 RepID=UPI00191BCD4C
MKDLRDAIYLLYGHAEWPQLEQLAQTITGDDDLPGSPNKDVISEIISGAKLATQQDTVTVAVVLARAARSDRDDVAILADNVRRLWDRAWMAPTPSPPARLGRPVADCDPLVLEVHPAIDIPGQEQLGSRLPIYVPRAHDERLQQVAAQVMDGSSRLVTLVGGSSTGKTRACWELAHHLDREQPGRWRLWHPFDPTRPEAAMAAIDQAGPYTIVWLNEAQHYLAPTDVRLGERIAAGLRTLLQDPSRGPVLVLATLWRPHWSTLTARPQPHDPDPHAQARDLLTGTEIIVPEVFAPGELAGLDAPGVDPRVRQAAVHAEGGRVIQYLAGAPVLEERYRTAPPGARAIMQVAMDARRLGHPLPIPHALLEQAAPGYLDDHDWDYLGEDWLEQALAYTATLCRGTRGPLTRIRTRPGDPPTADGRPCYRLADYLEQIGRRERGGLYPPDSFWTALAVTITDAVLLCRLGVQAQIRSRYQQAIWLYIRAADRGDASALWLLAGLRQRAGDRAGAEALYRQAADRGSIDAMRLLAWAREEAGDRDGAESLAIQAADRGDTGALRDLAGMWEEAGDRDGAESLAIQAADRGDTGALRDLAGLRQRAGDGAGAEALYQWAVERGDTGALRDLAGLRQRAGDRAGAEALYQWAVDRGDTGALRDLARIREEAGDRDGAESLAIQAADRGDTGALRDLAGLRQRAGDRAGAEALYQWAVDRGDTGALRDL